MGEKETMHKSDNVLEDMQQERPSSNGVQPDVPPITIPDFDEPIISEDLKGYLNDDGLKLLLGDDKALNEMASGIMEKKADNVNFSNMSLDTKDVEYAKKYFDAYRVKLSHDIPKPVAVIKLGGRAIATVADMTTITGQAKARKSYFLSAVLTAALNPTYYNGSLEVNLPDDRKKIIWIDTEQSEYWSQQILYRVKKSGVEENEIDERIIYMNCRDLSVDQLKAIVYVSMEKYSEESAFCIIDGSRDLVSSVNNEEEAMHLSRWLPEMAKKYKMNISNVIHQNPSGGTSSKLRGHLGTELMNKSEFVVEIQKHPKDKEVYVAASMLSRDIGTDDLCFTIVDGLLEFVGEPVDTKSEKSKFMYDFTIKQLKKLTRNLFMTKPNYNQKGLSIAIQTYIKESHEMHIGGQKIINEWIPYLENKGLIEIDTDGTSKNKMAKLYKKAKFADTDTHEIEYEEPPEIEDETDLPF